MEMKKYRKQNKTKIILVVLLACCLLLAACANQTPEPGSASDGKETEYSEKSEIVFDE